VTTRSDRRGDATPLEASGWAAASVARGPAAEDLSVGSTPTSKDFVVAAISAAIAILTDVITHFRWEVGWRSQSEALFGPR
jgi:hypothetical protein